MFELVSPTNTGSVDARDESGFVGASPGAERVAYFSVDDAFAIPGSCAPGHFPWYVSARIHTEWTTEAVLPCQTLSGVAPGFTEVAGFSEDLTESIVWSEGPALSEGAPEGGRDYYVRSAGGMYRLLAPVKDLFSFTGVFTLVGFSRDDSHVVFESEEALAEGAVSGVPNVYEADLDEPGPVLRVRLVGVVPAEGGKCIGEACEVSTGGSLAGAGRTPDHADEGREHYAGSAMSDDGSRVFFTAEPSGRIYAREGEVSTLAVSAGLGPAHFWGATPDGRYVFYTEGDVLWRDDVDDEQRVEVAAERGGVLGVLGFSEDGSTVYFAGTGVLSANKNEYGEKAASEPETANLYEWHMPPVGSVSTTFISTLTNRTTEGASGGDKSDWSDESGTQAVNGMKTARVSGNGLVLMFASHRSLTDYANERFQELFRYQAGFEGASGALVCVSCNPDGAPAKKAALFAGVGSEFETPLSELYLARNLSADGDRVFFVGEEGLVAGETSGSAVYEWEANGEGACESEEQDGGCLFTIAGGGADFLDASENGDDVFFLTREQLVEADKDNNTNVYDAHVCDPATEECEGLAAPTPCSGEGCLHAGESRPVVGVPGSMTFSGRGNVPIQEAKRKTQVETRHEKLVAALRACAKKPRRDRRRCEATARRLYGPTASKTSKPKRRKTRRGRKAGASIRGSIR